MLAITDELLRRVVEGWEPTGRWREDMRELGVRVHRVYVEHPQAGVLAASRVTGGPHEIQVIETVLGLLRTAGFPEREAVDVYHAFIDQMLGFAALDAAFEALPAEHQAHDDDTWRDTYARLPAETHPNIAATSRLLDESMRGSGFVVGPRSPARRHCCATEFVTRVGSWAAPSVSPINTSEQV